MRAFDNLSQTVKMELLDSRCSVYTKMLCQCSKCALKDKMKNSLKLTFCRSAVALIVACCGTTEPQDAKQAQKELVDF